MNEELSNINQDLNRCSYLISAIAETLSDKDYEASESLILIEKYLGNLANQVDRLSLESVGKDKPGDSSYMIR